MHNKYEVIGVVGEGAYGIVYKCKNKETNKYVAIKKFKEINDDLVKKTMKRELKILQKLHHPNIVDFQDAFKRKGNLFLVFEFCEKNLLELLQENPKGLDPSLIRHIIFQLCKAIKYLHEQNIIHRDVKPENLLITKNYETKLCDFGFSRLITSNSEKLTDYVATRWYRAPELLISQGDYDKEVDYWAIGCIMGELVDGNPLFPGENEIDQIHCIQKILGNLTQEQVDKFYSNPLFQGKNLLNVTKPETLERVYMGKLNKKAISFMKGLLEIDPKKRINDNNVFLHPYFEKLVSPEIQMEIKLKNEKNSNNNQENVNNNEEKVNNNGGSLSSNQILKIKIVQPGNVINNNNVLKNKINSENNKEVENLSNDEEQKKYHKNEQINLLVDNNNITNISLKKKDNNKIQTSTNINNQKENNNANLISYNCNPNQIDNAYKTFYQKNKDKDIYNIELDLQNCNCNDSNDNMKNIMQGGKNYEIIDEEEEFTKEEKIKMMQLAALYKKQEKSPGRIKYATKNSPPKNSPPKNYYNNNHGNKNNNGYNRFFHLPVIPKGTASNFHANYKKFNFH